MDDNYLPKSLAKQDQHGLALNFRAFTLVELVMVIVLLGILAGVSGPRFFSMTSFQEKFFVEDFLSALRYARLTSEVTNCRVQFNVQSSGFELKQNKNCSMIPLSNDFSFTVKRPSEPDSPYSNNEKPTSVNVSSVDSASATANTFYFLPSGRVTNASGTASDIVLTFSGAEVSQSYRIEQDSGYVH